MCCEVIDKKRVKEFEDKFFNDLKNKIKKFSYKKSYLEEYYVGVQIYEKGFLMNKYLYEVMDGSENWVWFYFNGEYIHVKSPKIYKFLLSAYKRKQELKNKVYQDNCKQLEKNFLNT